MKIKYVEFTLDKLFTEPQRVVFDADKICLIGENASGKSTFLYALQELLSDQHIRRKRYFKIVESKIVYTIEKDDSIRDVLNVNTSSKLEVIKNGNNHNYEFECPWLLDEFKHISNKILLAKRNLNDLKQDIRTKFKTFCNHEDIDPEAYITEYQFYNLDPESLERDIEKMNDELAAGLCKSSYGSVHLFPIYEPRFLVSPYENIRREKEFDDILELFSDYITTGEITNNDKIDNFITKNSDSEKRLSLLVDEYNQLVSRFNLLFSNYSVLHDYIQKNSIQSITLLNHNNFRSDTAEIFDFSLYGIKNRIYTQIYDMYESTIDDMFHNFEYYLNLVELKVLSRSYVIKSENEYSKQVLHNETNRKALKENQKDILSKLKRILLSRDIKDDYNDKFKKLYFQIEQSNILDMIEEHIFNIWPDYINCPIESIEINLDRNNNRVMNIIRDSQRTVLTDQSSGTIWAIKFELVSKMLNVNDILLIDEPGLFLHQNAQQHVVSRIINLNCKVIYSTHIPSLLPINLDSIDLYTIEKTDNVATYRKLKSNIEENLIDIFGLRYLKNVFADCSKKVLLVSPKMELTKSLEENKILVDIKILRGNTQAKVVKQISKILKEFNKEVVLLIKDTPQYDSRGNNYHVFSLNEIMDFISSHKNRDLSEILEMMIDESN